MIRYWKQAVAALLTAVSLQGCLSKDTVDPYEAETQSVVQIRSYVRQNNLKVDSTSSGLFYTITQANPTAKKPSVGEEVAFSFVIYNLNNQRLDSAGTTVPIYYLYGLNALLPGLDEGLGLMREGERATLLMPSFLAYGSQGNSNINVPANAPVRFDVRLLRSRTEEEQITDYVSSTAVIPATGPKPTVERTASGLRIIRTVTNPTGQSLSAGQTVTVNYSGRLLRATTNFDQGAFDLTLGRGAVVPGFEEGVRALRVGEKATIILPSSLGYGTAGRTNGAGQYTIAPYSPLRFDIEITALK